jgi:hypothetical protein
MCPTIHLSEAKFPHVSNGILNPFLVSHVAGFNCGSDILALGSKVKKKKILFSRI